MCPYAIAKFWLQFWSLITLHWWILVLPICLQLPNNRKPFTSEGPHTNQLIDNCMAPQERNRCRVSVWWRSDVWGGWYHSIPSHLGIFKTHPLHLCGIAAWEPLLSSFLWDASTRLAPKQQSFPNISFMHFLIYEVASLAGHRKQLSRPQSGNFPRNLFSRGGCHYVCSSSCYWWCWCWR